MNSYYQRLLSESLIFSGSHICHCLFLIVYFPNPIIDPVIIRDLFLVFSREGGGIHDHTLKANGKKNLYVRNVCNLFKSFNYI